MPTNKEILGVALLGVLGFVGLRECGRTDNSTDLGTGNEYGAGLDRQVTAGEVSVPVGKQGGGKQQAEYSNRWGRESSSVQPQNSVRSYRNPACRVCEDKFLWMGSCVGPMTQEQALYRAQAMRRENKKVKIKCD